MAKEHSGGCLIYTSAAACQRILPLPVDRTTVKGVGFDGESYFVVYR